MAAPDATLLAALRSTSPPVRHLFFRLDHSQGVVRAWDGVGEMVFDGETYIGIGALGAVSGIAISRDLQTQDVAVTLNGVTYASLQVTDSNIRNRDARISAVWFTVAGQQLASKRLFTGLGNYLQSEMGERDVRLTARLRGRIANWVTAPQRYYTDADQKRLFPGDTGMQFVRTLENTTVSGWNEVDEASGGTPKVVSVQSAYPSFYDSLLLRAIGDNANGVGFSLFPGNTINKLGSGQIYTDGVSNAVADLNSLVIGAGGVVAYLDAVNDVRSAAGSQITVGFSSTNRLRTCLAVAGIGTPTATFLQLVDVQLAGGGGNSGVQYFTQNGATLAFDTGTNNWVNVIFVNSTGQTPGSHPDIDSGLLGVHHNGAFATLVEEISGTAITVSGSSRMQCNGVDCSLSGTGVVLTNLTRRVLPSGGVVANDFLRLWT